MRFLGLDVKKERKYHKSMVCFGTKPWNELPDRTQHLMSHMKEMEIFYFYPPTSADDFPTEGKKVKVQSHIYAYALPKKLTVSSGSLLSEMKEKRLKQYVLRVMKRYRVRSPLVWCTHPLQLGFVDEIPYSQLIYDCSTFFREALFENQKAMLRRADLVFVASPKLKETVQEYQKNVVLLPHGVDYDLFEEKSRYLGESEGEKFFGFSGEIDADLDLSPLLYVAEKRPLWKFCLFGVCHPENPYIEELESLDNVGFCGQRLASETADFLLSCTVLMEFRSHNPKTDLQLSGILDYFSTGKPIVVSVWPNDVERFPDVMYNAFTDRDFLKQCEIALGESPRLVSDRRKKYGKNASWKKRANKVLKIFSTARF